MITRELDRSWTLELLFPSVRLLSEHFPRLQFNEACLPEKGIVCTRRRRERERGTWQVNASARPFPSRVCTSGKLRESFSP